MNKIFKLFFKELIYRRQFLIPRIILKIIFIFKDKYFSLNSLDKKIEKYLNYNKGFYVEIGANNGFDQSNTLYFEINRNWKGILIEPLSHKYLECKKLRGYSNHIFCNACVGKDFEKKFIKLNYLNLMTNSDDLDLMLGDRSNIEHINYGKKRLKKYEDFVQFSAITTTLNDILTKGRAPKLIDFLSLDVEGAEIEVLKGVDFENYNFKFILVELRDFTKGENFLKDKNYEFIESLSEHDYLFKYKGPITP